jgi:hypothetical protein
MNRTRDFGLLADMRFDVLAAVTIEDYHLSECDAVHIGLYLSYIERNEMPPFPG